MSNTPVKVFLSYAHEDEAYKDELMKFLSPLSRNKVINVWSDKAILVGDKWDDDIKQALLDAEIILFLVSPSFLASDYINTVEITMSMEKHTQKQTKIVPIMIRFCDFSSPLINDPNSLKLSDFQGLPKAMKPIKSWTDSDEAWMDVIKGLERLIIEMNKTRDAANGS